MNQLSEELRLIVSGLQGQAEALKVLSYSLPEGCTDEVILAALTKIELAVNLLDQEADALDKYGEEE